MRYRSDKIDNSNWGGTGLGELPITSQLPNGPLCCFSPVQQLYYCLILLGSSWWNHPSRELQKKLCHNFQLASWKKTTNDFCLLPQINHPSPPIHPFAPPIESLRAVDWRIALLSGTPWIKLMKPSLARIAKEALPQLSRGTDERISRHFIFAFS